MNPGATARPAASIVLLAGPDNLPISTILPSLTPTSPRKAGMPEPSTTRPFLISKSYAIGFLLALGSAAARPDRQHLTTQFRRQSRAFPAWIEAEPCGNSPSPAPRDRMTDAARRPGQGRGAAGNGLFTIIADSPLMRRFLLGLVLLAVLFGSPYAALVLNQVMGPWSATAIEQD